MHQPRCEVAVPSLCGEKSKLVRPAAACSPSPQAMRDRRPAQSQHNRPDMNTAAATTRAGLMFPAGPYRECDAGVGYQDHAT